mmetsp:Transcript_26495/g.77917  ORF Transcript_26495/g.77917 Transcript_26495/m.77917 type:complete len:443 (-) Transcript_26495:514-1842(-)
MRLLEAPRKAQEREELAAEAELEQHVHLVAALVDGLEAQDEGVLAGHHHRLLAHHVLHLLVLDELALAQALERHRTVGGLVAAEAHATEGALPENGEGLQVLKAHVGRLGAAGELLALLDLVVDDLLEVLAQELGELGAPQPHEHAVRPRGHGCVARLVLEQRPLAEVPRGLQGGELHSRRRLARSLHHHALTRLDDVEGRARMPLLEEHGPLGDLVCLEVLDQLLALAAAQVAEELNGVDDAPVQVIREHLREGADDALKVRRGDGEYLHVPLGDHVRLARLARAGKRRLAEELALVHAHELVAVFPGSHELPGPDDVQFLPDVPVADDELPIREVLRSERIRHTQALLVREVDEHWHRLEVLPGGVDGLRVRPCEDVLESLAIQGPEPPRRLADHSRRALAAVHDCELTKQIAWLVLDELLLAAVGRKAPGAHHVARVTR